MAYPGEKEHVEYLDYVEDMVAKGEPHLSKDEWRRKIKNAENKRREVPSALKEY